ncbi:MAG: DUF58 domain-containing protein [Chloroflexota bacterium]
MSAGSPPTFGFQSAFLQRLERLAVLSRRPLPGDSAGTRSSPRLGASVEFADFREYAPGDDFRRIDWNTYARLDRLFVRLYTAEERTTLTLLLDHSRSMSFGTPSKMVTSARIAAIFSYIALSAYDRVMVAGWGDRNERALRPLSGKASVTQLWRAISAIAENPSDAPDLSRCGRSARTQGLAIVIGDLLTESDWRSGLKGLKSAGQEVSVVQILSSEELDPQVRGDWKLRDSESGTEIEITASPRALKRYAQELEAHTAMIEEFCARQAMSFTRLSSDVDVEGAALHALHLTGVIA